MTPEEITLKNKLLEGIHLSCNLMLKEKKKANNDLFISIDGKIVKIKARKIKVVEPLVSIN